MAPTPTPAKLVLPSIQQLVAHYLLSSGYEASLAAFLKETSVSSSDFADSPRPSVDLREVVEEYNVEKLRSAMLLLKVDQGGGQEEAILKREVKEEDLPKKVVKTLGDVHLANILTVTSHDVPIRTFDTSTASYTSRLQPSLLTTASDKSLKITDLHSGEAEAIFNHHKAAILSVATHPTQPRLIVTASMDSTAKLLDLVTRKVLQTFSHQKFVVKAVFSSTGKWLATASYDRTIKLYSLVPPAPRVVSYLDDPDEPNEDPLGKDVEDRWELRKVIETKSNPEGLVFGPTDEDGAWLAFTTREDNYIKYLMLPSTPKPLGEGDDATEEPFEIKRFNLNPNGDDHLSFSVLSLALHPGGKHIALLTGNHASGNLSRIFLYPFLDGERKLTLWTGASCDEFSSPRMAWFPDGSAVAVTSDDGAVRVVDLQGRVRSTIAAHGVHPLTGVRNEMIRDVCVVVPKEDEGGKIQVVSCGFDQTVRVMQ
ncbi:WD40-repeat-containing domain protein [Mrakia frigida]|uniref:WD40-repeat-containing domain protein n=1 Tax=Mrakia frigida TaxID=29902 RepID=UPI003FCC25E5